MTTMRAAILRGEAGGGQFAVEDAPIPTPQDGDVLVRVLRTGICGSDVHFVLDGRARPAYTPIILGHESMGVVERTGGAVPGLEPGTRVSIVPLVTCGVCRHCRAGRTVLCLQRACLGSDVEGTYAEYAVVPARNCIPVPDGLADELAAVATDSVSTALHAVATRGNVGPDTRVAVWGTGGLGLSAVGIAHALGAQVIAVDMREEARQWALDSGADEALHPDVALDRITAHGGVDVALEFVGTQRTAELAVRSLDHGGRAVIVGVGPDTLTAGRLMTFVLREREVVGAYGNEPHEVAQALEMLASGRLRLPHVIGDVLPLTDVVAGMHRVHEGRTGGSRIVLDITA